MCNRYGYRHPYRQLLEEFSDLGPIRWAGLEPNAPRDDIRPTDPAPIIREVGGELELAELRWGLIPWYHQGPTKGWKVLGTNARSESCATTSMYKEPFRRRRCLVPATHFFEWTGEKGRKTMWRFSAANGEPFAFPGLWDRARTSDGPVESFTLLTCAPGPDAAPYHDRQPVILGRASWPRWLDLDADPAPLLRPGPAGSLAVARVS
ncbi:MAG TPA: SOS response-associated peptidase [Caulobacteraceae bacterium]|nr:SOS response-associated peptidase [Caulobacteraceae bacterium]